MKTIILVEDIETLRDLITDYDRIAAKMQQRMGSNNEKFCGEFEKIVTEIFEEKEEI